MMFGSQSWFVESKAWRADALKRYGYGGGDASSDVEVTTTDVYWRWGPEMDAKHTCYWRWVTGMVWCVVAVKEARRMVVRTRSVMEAMWKMWETIKEWHSFGNLQSSCKIGSEKIYLFPGSSCLIGEWSREESSDCDRETTVKFKFIRMHMVIERLSAKHQLVGMVWYSTIP